MPESLSPYEIILGVELMINPNIWCRIFSSADQNCLWHVEWIIN